MARLFLVALIVLGGPALAFAQRGAGRGAGGVAAATAVTVVAGDVTDAASVAALAKGHDVAVNTAAAL